MPLPGDDDPDAELVPKLVQQSIFPDASAPEMAPPRADDVGPFRFGAAMSKAAHRMAYTCPTKQKTRNERI